LNVIRRWFPSLKSDAALGRATCPRCGDTSPLYFQTKDFNRKISEETFTYYRCPSCHLIFLSPIPSNLGDYYPETYHSGTPTLGEIQIAAQTEQYKIDLVSSFVSSGRLLEIGPSWGTFLYLAKQAGFEAEAMEMDARCCQFLSEQVGVRAIQGSDVDKRLRREGGYDVIALWHVIEHLSNPWSTLPAIAEALLPGGIAVIAAPNPSAIQFLILGRFWTHVDAPRHVELIPASLLAEKMESLGLDTILNTTTDKGGLGWNSFGWEYSLSNFFLRPTLKHYARKAGIMVGHLLKPLEGMEGYGSAYTLVFQRKK